MTKEGMGVKIGGLVAAISVLLLFGYLFTLAGEDTVALFMVFASLFLVLVLASIILQDRKKRK